MTARNATVSVEITPEEISRAFCFSEHTIGNTERQFIQDIVYVKPGSFEPARMREIASQVAAMNSLMEEKKRQYLLAGPGRWGSADTWLGIPVRWADISNVAAIVETVSPKLNAEPSQGAHFFHNLASLGISYLSVLSRKPDHFDWNWLADQQINSEKQFVAHVRLDNPLVLKVDGRSSQGVIFPDPDSDM
jgi:hypothetical protein